MAIFVVIPGKTNLLPLSFKRAFSWYFIISSTNIEDADYDATQNIQDVEKNNKALKGSLNLNISEPSTQGTSDSYGEAGPGIYCADKSRNTVELGLLSGASEEQKKWYLENCK